MGKVTSMTEGTDGITITAVLDDGTDADGKPIDPDCMYDMAARWMETGPHVTLGWSYLHSAGVGRAVWRDGDKTMAEILVSPEVAGMLRKGVMLKTGLGIARPQVTRDWLAPSGRITAGDLMNVNLSEDPKAP